LNGQLWVSRVVQIIRILEQDSKHVELLAKLDQGDRGLLELACRTVAWLHNVCLRFVLLICVIESSFVRFRGI
jgi:hypothetical protein